MGYKILFTDDEPLLRKVGTAMLTQLGHVVVETGDGLDALEILENNDDFDLLMTDLLMPEGIGGEMLALKAKALRPNIKIIVLSGYTDTLSLPTGTFPENTHFLAKPFKMDQLRNALSERFK